MAFQLSPGVNVSEIDLTTVVPAVATSDGAIAGVFRWGPVGERVFVESENALVSRFGKPTNLNAETFFTAANFLSYANRLYVSRAANTTGASPYVSANATGANNILDIGNTSAISVGMYLTQVGEHANVWTGNLASVSVLSKNSTHITVTSNTKGTFANVNLYFGRPETSYSAVGFDLVSNTNARAANLVNQIIRNENEYAIKDGLFDEDVIYVAKYPGAIGNSLRVSVCDSSDSFNSVINFAPTANVGNTVVNTAVSTAIAFDVGSNVAHVKFPGTATAQILAAQTFASHVINGDRLLAGNSQLGLQYLKITSTEVGANSLYFHANTVEFDGNTDINSVANFIRIPNNPYANGDYLLYQYADPTQTGDIGLVDGEHYYVVEANSSGIKLAETPFGAEVNLTGNVAASQGEFTANNTVLKIHFEDPFRLRAHFAANTIERYWEFFNVVDTAPGQSDFVLYNGNTAANDELHIVVVDELGQFSGTPGQILEVYRGVSRATDAKNADGSGNYYKEVVNQASRYIWWTRDRSVALSATALNIESSTALAPASIQMQLGSDGLGEADIGLSTLGAAYDLFASAEDIDISLVLQGKPIGGITVVNGQTVQNFQLANYLIDNIAEIRKDCVVLISPDKDIVLNNVGDEAVSLKNWRGAIHSSSYAVLDSGYKYQYDRYNDLYRWIPLNGDIAGVCVRTDNTNDAWWSPAGFNRGQIKNLVKLAFNPRKAERDILYSNGINPVVTFPGQGTVLFGDKTLQAKPSAFDRINVRRLFIVLEKAISTAAKYSLFEFNDAFTRAQFRNLVTPYLRTIKGRRGITDFLVVCDETNNTAQIIDSNQFIGDIYIKPARSINFIQLNFVAVPSGVQFSEVVGKF